MTNPRNPNIGVNWSELHPDLLDYVARKLTIYTDYVRFRAVCVKWRSGIPPLPHHLPTQFPWVMVHSRPQGAFFSLLENKVHQFDTSEAGGKLCCGSTQGWLVLVERNPTITLLNPLTRTQFNLPPLTTFPYSAHYNAHNVGEEYDKKYLCTISLVNFFVKKIVLTSSPTSPNHDYTAVAVICGRRNLVFCRKGQREWTAIESNLDHFEDVICYKDMLYAITGEWKLAIYDLSSRFPSLETEIAPPLPRANGKAPRNVYLVESSGEIFMVKRYTKYVYKPQSYNYNHRGTVGFDVFVLDSSQQQPKWVEVKSLGNRMFFLGMNSSLCLLASDFTACEGNCIYFAGDQLREWIDDDEWEPVDDSGMFNLGDGSIKPLPYFTDKLSIPLPVWLTPNPC